MQELVALTFCFQGVHGVAHGLPGSPHGDGFEAGVVSGVELVAHDWAGVYLLKVFEFDLGYISGGVVEKPADVDLSSYRLWMAES